MSNQIINPSVGRTVFALPPEQKAELVALLDERERRQAQRLFYALYPEEDTIWDGPSIMGGLIQRGQILYSRHKYPKHMEFIAAGREYRERCAMMANRVGKTFGLGGYEVAAHLTGEYPDWWNGKRFNHPISAWAAGDTYLTTRDIMQLTLLGEVTWRDGRKVMDGRGIVPGNAVGSPIWHSGVQNLVDTIPIRHISGGWSQLGFKSFDQGRRVFQGVGRHVIWADEECPMDVYNECLIRTATVGGIMILTFTPLSGITEVVQSFLPGHDIVLDEATEDYGDA